MTRLMKILPVIAGAVAGAIVALLIAGGGGSTKTVTDEIVSQAAHAIPASNSTTGAMTVNQIYKQDSPGVVDIIVNSVQTNNSFFGPQQQKSQDEGAETRSERMPDGPFSSRHRHHLRVIPRLIHTPPQRRRSRSRDAVPAIGSNS